MKFRNNMHPRVLAVASVCAMLLLSACDALRSEEQSVRADLTFGAVAQSAVGKAGQLAQSDVVVEQVKLLVKHVKFQAGDDSTEVEFKTGPFAVTIDPQGSANTVVVGAIPPDTYDRVTFKIHKPEDTEPVPDPEFREGERGSERYSMIIRGTYQGQPFTLKLNEGFQQRIALNPPLVVNEGDQGVSVSLLADLSSWFTGRNGEALNPLNEEDVAEIEDAIEDSFRGLSTKRTGNDDAQDDESGDDNGGDTSGSDDVNDDH